MLCKHFAAKKQVKKTNKKAGEILKNTLGLLVDVFPQAMGYLFPLQQVVFGLLIVVFLVFEPHGLAEMWRRLKDYFRLWPFEY